MCLSPVYIKNDRYNVTLPCGKCAACLQRKRVDWSFRLYQELKEAETAWFVTLTYSDENLTFADYEKPTLLKRDLQLFIKNIREKVAYNEKQRLKLRYYFVGEYGPKTERPHYHGILFNLPKCYVEKKMAEDKIHVLPSDLDNAWSMGFVDVGPAEPGGLHYTTKYCINSMLELKDRLKTFAIMSRRPGIGFNYLVKNGMMHKKSKKFYTTVEGGFKLNLPRYYRDKIFNRKESQEHFLEMQEKFDKRANDKYNELIKSGGSIGTYEIQVREQMKQRVKEKLRRNSNL